MFLGPQHRHRSTRDGSRTLVCSVNSTDAKGQEMNEVARNIMVAAYGTP